MTRVFLDANCLFSAAYREEAGIIRLWELDDVELMTSAYALEEARRNLSRQEQRQRLDKLTRSVKVIAVHTPDLSLPEQILLPEKDRPILLAAVHSGATHLLTGDNRHFGRYYEQVVEGVLILPPAEFLRTHRSGSKS
jgi:predicted nucleic acid-binding protein